MKNSVFPLLFSICATMRVFGGNADPTEPEHPRTLVDADFSERKEEAVRIARAIERSSGNRNLTDFQNRLHRLGFDFAVQENKIAITNEARARVLSELSRVSHGDAIRMQNDLDNGNRSSKWMELRSAFEDCFRAGAVPGFSSRHWLDFRLELESDCNLSRREIQFLSRFEMVSFLSGMYLDDDGDQESWPDEKFRLRKEAESIARTLSAGGLTLVKDRDHLLYRPRRSGTGTQLARAERFDRLVRFGDGQMTIFPVFSFVSSAPILLHAEIRELAQTDSDGESRLFRARVLETLKGEKMAGQFVFSAPRNEKRKLRRPVLDSNEYLLFLCPVPPPVDLSEKASVTPQYKLFGFWQGTISLSEQTDEWSNFVLEKQFGISSPDAILPFFRFAVRYAEAEPEEREKMDLDAGGLGEPYEKLVESAKAYFKRKESGP